MNYCHPCLERYRVEKPAAHIVGDTFMCTDCFRDQDPPALKITARELRDVINLRKRVRSQDERLRELQETVKQLVYKKKYMRVGGEHSEMEKVKSRVANYFGEDRIRLHGNRPHEVMARYVAYQLCRNMGYSMPEIGQAFCCHHTTVMYALRKVERDVELQRAVTALTLYPERRLDCTSVAAAVSPVAAVQ